MGGGRLDRDKGNGKRQLYQKSKARDVPESFGDHHAMLKRPQPPIPSSQSPQTHPLFCITLLPPAPQTQAQALPLRQPTPCLYSASAPHYLTLPQPPFSTELILGGFGQVCTWAPSLSTAKAVDGVKPDDISYTFHSQFLTPVASELKPVYSHQGCLAGRNLCASRPRPTKKLARNWGARGGPCPGDPALRVLSPRFRGTCRMHPPPYLLLFVSLKVASNTENLGFGPR